MTRRLPAYDRLLIDLVDERAVASDLIDWAVETLVAGFDSPALRVLAGHPRTGSVEPATEAFRRALGELGFAIPDNACVRRGYLRWLSSQLIDGTLDPAEALDLVHARVVTPLEHPNDLMPWCYLSDGLHPETFRELCGDDLAAEVRRQAQLSLDDS